MLLRMAKQRMVILQQREITILVRMITKKEKMHMGKKEVS